MRISCLISAALVGAIGLVSAPASVMAATITINNCSFNLASGDSLSIAAATGDVTVQTDTTLGSGTGCPALATLAGGSGTVTGPAIGSFTASPSSASISTGGNTSTTLSWSNVTNASSCTISVNNSTGVSGATFPLAISGGSIASGSQAVTLAPTGSFTYTFTMSCTGGLGTTPASLARNMAVTVGTTVPSQCDGVPPTGFTASIKTFSQFFGAGYNWPASPSPRRQMNVSRQQYTSIQFTTGNADPASRTIKYVQAEHGGAGDPAGTFYPMDYAFLTVSRCPGDFRLYDEPGTDPPYVQCRAHFNGFEGTLSYGVYSTPPNAWTCSLQPNTTYYFNLVAANANDGVGATEHTCTSNRNSCGLGILFQ